MKRSKKVRLKNSIKEGIISVFFAAYIVGAIYTANNASFAVVLLYMTPLMVLAVITGAVLYNIIKK